MNNETGEKHGMKTACLACILVFIIGCLALAACAPHQAESSPKSTAHGELTSGTQLTVTTPITAETDQIPTMSKHDARGVDCIQCHDTATPTSAPTSDKSCLSCHNRAQLAADTADMEDIPNRGVNPHENHMHGASCLSCHSEHGVSKVACNECHTNEYNWLVP